ncbi:hypothetical protein PoB_003293100 [Plakobranchus ocellatus]|uniref:Uncharacterized protein n=1 Tax=Plakobranchus ocellatus TaxID=259542 RepID=A0AAV4ADH9_9GAST|nr:hypothetical protein PoB_003293100 [Plakobranchus ocellatus]
MCVCVCEGRGFNIDLKLECNGKLPLGKEEVGAGCVGVDEAQASGINHCKSTTNNMSVKTSRNMKKKRKEQKKYIACMDGPKDSPWDHIAVS